MIPKLLSKFVQLTFIQSPALTGRRHSTINTLGIVAVTLESSGTIEHFTVVQLVQAVTVDSVDHLVDGGSDSILNSSSQGLF